MDQSLLTWETVINWPLTTLYSTTTLCTDYSNRVLDTTMLLSRASTQYL